MLDLPEPDHFPSPLFDLVILIAEKNKMVRGIHLPDTAEQPHAYVAAVGPGRWDHGVFVKTSLKPGDRVLLNAPQGAMGELMWEGQKIYIVREVHIGCVVPEEREVSRVVPVEAVIQ